MVTRWNSEHEEVRATNIFMGNLQTSLDIMLNEEDGIDRDLLWGKDGTPVSKDTLWFTPNDHTILRQYECAAEPVSLLSKFFQLNVPTAHLVLVHLRVRIAQMREKSFRIYADISYLDEPDLTRHSKTETVLSEDNRNRNNMGRVESMMECVKKFRSLFADSLSLRCGLIKEIAPGQAADVERLPTEIAIAALLHPLLGGKCLTLLLCR